MPWASEDMTRYQWAWIDAAVVRGEIGRGSVGVVVKVEGKDQRILARKRVRYKELNIVEDRAKSQIMIELRILKELHHPNIVSLWGWAYDHDAGLFDFYMEYCSGGTLLRQLDLGRSGRRRYYDDEYHDPVIPEELIWKWTTQLLSALRSLHAKQILHRDLKPENIYLDAQNNVKLGDFSLSKIVLDMALNSASTLCGTYQYVAPEVWERKGYGSPVDIYSLGLVMFEMCEGTLQDAKALHESSSILMRRVSPFKCTMSRDLKELIKKMVNPKPEQRPTAESLCQSHPRISRAIYDLEMQNAETLRQQLRSTQASLDEAIWTNDSLDDNNKHLASSLEECKRERAELIEEVGREQLRFAALKDEVEWLKKDRETQQRLVNHQDT